MTIKPETVDDYFDTGCGRCKYGGTPDCKVQTWGKELRALRKVLQQTDLTEELKWSAPCYTSEGKNILMLATLKDGVTINFFRGSQMQDPDNILEKPGENSRFARYLRFPDVKTIASLKNTLLTYIQEAIAIEKSGVKADKSKDAPLKYPEELIQLFEEHPDLEEAFHALTPGRQRGYLLYFASAKQSKTKTARIEKSMPAIKKGKGWNER